MRSRLLLVVLVLVGLLAAGLGVPLAWTAAQRAQEEVFTDRLTDTISFASTAQRPLIETPAGSSALTTFTDEITRYDDVYGVAVLVLDRAGRTVTASRPADRLPELGTTPSTGPRSRSPGAAPRPTRCSCRGTTGRWCWPSRYSSTARWSARW